MPEECRNKDFADLHYQPNNMNPFSNRCLPFMTISMDDRIKKLEQSNVACPICLRRLGNKTGGVGQTCGVGQHRQTPFKCLTNGCEKDVMVCKTHAEHNEQNHGRYRNALRWMERNTGRSQINGQSISNTSLIIISDEMEQCLNSQHCRR